MLSAISRARRKSLESRGWGMPSWSRAVSSCSSSRSAALRMSVTNRDSSSSAASAWRRESYTGRRLTGHESARAVSLRLVLDTVPERQATNPPADARALEDVVLQDHEGNPVRLGDVWQDRPAVIAFLRHYGCVFCRDQAVQFHKLRDDFEEAGVRLVV